MDNSIHPIEAILFQNVITDLRGKESADAYCIKENKDSYPDNVVVVDTFVRDNHGNIRNSNESLPETHTIVLWKSGANKIVLIDPNNVNFSSRIRKPLQEMLGNNMQVETMDSKMIDRIYQPESSNIGRGERNDRDCIDVAVKMGFILNALQKDNSSSEPILTAMIGLVSNRGEVLKPYLNIQNPQTINQYAKGHSDIMRDVLSSNVDIRNTSREAMLANLLPSAADSKSTKSGKKKDENLRR